MKCIHELFSAQAELTPDAIAVFYETECLTYKELNRRAEMLALRLRESGVGTGDLVALFVDRSPEMVIGMLAILKAGGAYVPLDPAHPPKRLAYIFSDAKPTVILTQKHLKFELPAHDARVILTDDECPQPVSGDHEANSHHVAKSTDLAYVIYTSGSTGQPKGVEIEHRSVANMLASVQRRPGLTAADKMLAITTLTFDIAVLELFLPLVCGASVVIASRQAAGDGPALIELIERSGVSTIQATPATLRMLLDAGWSGNPGIKIFCGGEAWGEDLAGRLLGRCQMLWNMYGPTETTVWSAVGKVEAGKPVVIGRPIAHTHLYVLDSARQLVPIGVAGELYIGGEGLARGYLHRPELTEERFVVNPFTTVPGARMYRTGDSVRRQPNGSLEFLGRLDHQVKIRGFRVELGESEAALERVPGVRQAVVIAEPDPNGEHRLIGYYIAASLPIPAAELRARLAETLPGYMVPNAFVPVASFPLTPNGKIDRKSLPAVAEAATLEGGSDLVEARTANEKLLTQIWSEMLGNQRIGVHSNFFELGGHSLLAVRVVARINKTLDLRLNVVTFFMNPTIARLAAVLDESYTVRAGARIVTLRSGAGLPLYLMGARPDEYRIAELIQGDRPLVAIDTPIDLGPPAPTIDELGTLFADSVGMHANTSPCVIIGYSLGGKIAFETARALQRAGREVAFVLLVDAWATSWYGTNRGFRESLRWIWRGIADQDTRASKVETAGASLHHLRRLAWWAVKRIPGVIGYRLELLKQRLHVGDGPLAPLSDPSGYFDTEGTPIDRSTLFRLAYTAGGQWRPEPLDMKGILIRSRNANEETLPGYDRLNGWRDLFSQGLEVVQADGDHNSMLGNEYAAHLSQQMTSVLNRYEAQWISSRSSTPVDTNFGTNLQGLSPHQAAMAREVV